MNFKEMIPSLGAKSLMDILDSGQYHVDHGSIARFPEFLHPGKGALSSINYLGQWRHFDVGYRDRAGKYNQVNSNGGTPLAYYEMGALVRSSMIDDAHAPAKLWLEDWARALGVFPQDLRLNSWAVRGANGIDWHFDPEDVIHFQIKGDKLLKFLPSEKTRYADSSAKRLERFYKVAEDFDKAEGHIVKEGTITIIPRGVWHWSESQSDESFAVSLCVSPPSVASTVTQSLYRKLRLLEDFRYPMQGSKQEQLTALNNCLDEIRLMVSKLSAETLMAEERRLELPMAQIDSLHFHANPVARVEMKPTLKIMMGDRALAFDGNDRHAEIVRKICESGVGFTAKDLTSSLPNTSAAEVHEVIASLYRVGFLEMIG